MSAYGKSFAAPPRPAPVGSARVPRRQAVNAAPKVQAHPMLKWRVVGLHGFSAPVLARTGLQASDSIASGMVLSDDIVAIVPNGHTGSEPVTELWSSDMTRFVGDPWDAESGQSTLLRDVAVRTRVVEGRELAEGKAAARETFVSNNAWGGISPWPNVVASVRRLPGAFVLPVEISTRPRTIAHYVNALAALQSAEAGTSDGHPLSTRLLAQWQKHIEAVRAAIPLAEMALPGLREGDGRPGDGADMTLEKALSLRDARAVRGWLNAARMVVRASEPEISRGVRASFDLGG